MQDGRKSDERNEGVATMEEYWVINSSLFYEYVIIAVDLPRNVTWVA